MRWMNQLSSISHAIFLTSIWMQPQVSAQQHLLILSAWHCLGPGISTQWECGFVNSSALPLHKLGWISLCGLLVIFAYQQPHFQGLSPARA